MDARRRDTDPDQSIVYRLAAEVPCDYRTARAYLRGRSPRCYALAARLDDAAEQLGLRRGDPMWVRHGS